MSRRRIWRNSETIAIAREQAKERQEARDKRTAQEQLDLLDKRLGKGVGAKRERARLAQEV